MLCSQGKGWKRVSWSLYIDPSRVAKIGQPSSYHLILLLHTSTDLKRRKRISSPANVLSNYTNALCLRQVAQTCLPTLRETGRYPSYFPHSFPRFHGSRRSLAHQYH